MKKILVVGGGPIGLTVGIELSRHKIIPDLIDKKKNHQLYPGQLEYCHIQ